MTELMAGYDPAAKLVVVLAFVNGQATRQVATQTLDEAKRLRAALDATIRQAETWGNPRCPHAPPVSAEPIPGHEPLFDLDTLNEDRGRARLGLPPQSAEQRELTARIHERLEAARRSHVEKLVADQNQAARNALTLLGFTQHEISGMSVEEARDILANRSDRRPI